MIEGIRRFFQRELDTQAPAPAETNRRCEATDIAACALLLEIAHADDGYTDQERAHLLETLHREFEVDVDLIDELEALAATERRESVDLWQFTSLLNARYDEADKERLLESAWRIVFADGVMTKHEHYLIRKIASLLDVNPVNVHRARQRAYPQSNE